MSGEDESIFDVEWLSGMQRSSFQSLYITGVQGGFLIMKNIKIL